MIKIGESVKAMGFENSVKSDPLCNELENPFSKLKQQAEKYGCKYFAMFHSPRVNQSFSDVLIYANWPQDIFDDSVHFSAARSTDLAKRVNETIVPFQWSFEIIDNCSIADAESSVVELFHSLQVLDGLIIPVHGPSENVGFVVLGALKNSLKPNQISKLQSLSIELFDLHFKARRAKVDSQGRLTPREVKVLQFMVDGKGVDEIAKIMKLSPMTISIYASSAKSKLNSSTKIQTVARAMRNGIIG